MSNNAIVIALFTAFAGIVLLDSLQTTQNAKNTLLLQTQITPSPSFTPSLTQQPSPTVVLSQSPTPFPQRIQRLEHGEDE